MFVGETGGRVLSREVRSSEQTLGACGGGGYIALSSGADEDEAWPSARVGSECGAPNRLFLAMYKHWAWKGDQDADIHRRYEGIAIQPERKPAP